MGLHWTSRIRKTDVKDRSVILGTSRGSRETHFARVEGSCEEVQAALGAKLSKLDLVLNWGVVTYEKASQGDPALWSLRESKVLI